MTPPVTADLLGFSRTTISRLYSDSESPKKEVSIQRVAVVKKKKKNLVDVRPLHYSSIMSGFQKLPVLSSAFESRTRSKRATENI